MEFWSIRQKCKFGFPDLRPGFGLLCVHWKDEEIEKMDIEKMVSKQDIEKKFLHEQAQKVFRWEEGKGLKAGRKRETHTNRTF